MWGLGIRELSSTGMGSGVGGCRVSGLDMASGTPRRLLSVASGSSPLLTFCIRLCSLQQTLPVDPKTYPFKGSTL